VVLEDLDPTASYRGRAVAIGPDGSEAAGEELPTEFRARPDPRPGSKPASELPKMGQAPGIHDPEPVPFSEQPLAIPLAVRNPHDFDVDRWPITTGIPFARGALTDPNHARLVCGADEVPAQIQLTARWPDGSVKWLLITFLARVPAARPSGLPLGMWPGRTAGCSGRRA
jgi:hypothetical protein